MVINFQRGRTPLHYAAVLSDNGEIYKRLLDHGADIKATDVVSFSLLFLLIPLKIHTPRLNHEKKI